MATISEILSAIRDKCQSGSLTSRSSLLCGVVFASVFVAVFAFNRWVSTSHYPAWMLYLVAINVTAFTIMACDKIAAQRGKPRIPEATILAASVLGGSIGALLAAHFARHKTKKASFQFVLVAIMVVQITLLSSYLSR